MSVVDQILGRRKLSEDEPPVQAARPPQSRSERKATPKDKTTDKLKDAARRSAIVTSIIGMTESDEESIIPDDASRVDGFNDAWAIPGIKDDPGEDAAPGTNEPATTYNNGEELIPPTAALVAPDITPELLKPIDPASVPTPAVATAPANPAMPPATAQPPGQPPQHALDTILGRQNPAQEMPPVTAESFMQIVDEGEIKSKAMESLIPASDGGSAMPLHKESDGRAIYDAFRRFNG